jgi:subtilisin family serine protease
VIGPEAENPGEDEDGHGTGESANLFAIAPDVDFTMVKFSFLNTVGAFNAAVALNPNIISCSWTIRSDKEPQVLSAEERVLGAAVAYAVSRGIFVVFAAGNGHYGFAAQHPDIISVGGVYMDQDTSLQATPYASGFAGYIYPGRNVPDVCGLVGLLPSAAYIMLPIPPGCRIDMELASGRHPDTDETRNNDGWAAFSGTSAAAPQVAGICALMKQAYPRLSPAEARDILKRTARDITAGRSGADGENAKPGPDIATGHGLADAYQAILATLQTVT